MKYVARHPKIVCGIITLGLFWGCSFSFAKMYRCEDSAGKVSYTNLPAVQKNCSPLEMKAIRRVPRRTATYKYWRSGLTSFDNYILAAGRQFRIDPSLIKAIIYTESNFDHRAISSMGAQGLMQLMPGTADDLGVVNVFDPKENITAGTRYFRQQLDTFQGNVVFSLAAYNAGPGLVKRLGAIPQNSETKNYIKKVLYHYKKYKAQERR